MLLFFSCPTWYSLYEYSFIWVFFLPCKFQVGTFLPDVVLSAMQKHSSLCRSSLSQKSIFIPTHKESWLVTSHILLYLTKSQPFPGRKIKAYLVPWGPSASCLELQKFSERHFGQLWLWSISPDEPLEVSTKRIWSTADSNPDINRSQKYVGT